jgi:hypothetical protein
MLSTSDALSLAEMSCQQGLRHQASWKHAAVQQ